MSSDAIDGVLMVDIEFGAGCQKGNVSLESLYVPMSHHQVIVNP